MHRIPKVYRLQTHWLKHYLYLSLVTDLYSHKIVGWAIGPTLEREYPLKALRMAMATLPKGDVPTLIHHSDRGCQYCSSDYVEALRERKIQISMTQTGDPLENPVAERANGILKTEWLYHMEPISEKKCPDTIGRIIAFYNNERPHMSIGYQTPSEAHRQSGEQKKCWKNPWDRPKETGKHLYLTRQTKSHSGLSCGNENSTTTVLGIVRRKSEKT